MSDPVPASAPPESKARFVVGMIGAGGIAHAHAQNLLRIPGVEVLCATDPNAKVLQEFAQRYNLPRTYADYREMLAQERGLDGVCVCTPNALHAPAAIAALGAGCHVLVEKPMAMHVQECRALIAAAHQAQRHLVVGFQHRFDGRSQLIRSQFEAGTFGPVLHVRCQALRRRGIPNWGVFGRKELQGGGPLIDIGVHVLEMAHYCMGAPLPLSASGQTWTYLGNRPGTVACTWPGWDWASYTVEDLAVGMIRFAGGATLTIESSFAAHIEQDVWNFTLMGERGGACWDPIKVFTDRDGYMFNLTPVVVPNQGWDPIWMEKMRHFVGVCRDGWTNMATGEMGLMVQQMIDGIYRSAATGGEVQL